MIVAMTREEVSSRYCISESVLRYYEETGLLQNADKETGEPVYEDQEISLLGLVQSLFGMGMEVEELRQYLTLRKSPVDTRGEQIRILREHRAKLLHALHDQRAALESLDYLIYQTEKGGKTDEQKL